MALLFHTGNAMAQLEEGDTARWQFNANLSLRLNAGNVERLIVTPEANMAHVSNNQSWGFSARQRYTYGTFGSFRSENDFLSRNFIYLHPSKRIYPYFMAWFHTHERQRLAFRYQAGPGITFVPFRKRQQLVKLSATLTHEYNRYRQGNLEYIDDAAATSYSTFRATGRLFGSHSFAQGNASVYYELLYQQSLNNGSNWRIFSESGLNVRIVRGFSMRTYVNYEYHRVHVRTQRPNDLVLNVGVNYRVATGL